VLYTWLYLLFIDKLLNDLEHSGHECNMGALKVGNPTLADDLTLVSQNKKLHYKAKSISL